MKDILVWIIALALFGFVAPILAFSIIPIPAFIVGAVYSLYRATIGWLLHREWQTYSRAQGRTLDFTAPAARRELDLDWADPRSVGESGVLKERGGSDGRAA